MHWQWLREILGTTLRQYAEKARKTLVVITAVCGRTTALGYREGWEYFGNDYGGILARHWTSIQRRQRIPRQWLRHFMGATLRQYVEKAQFRRWSGTKTASVPHHYASLLRSNANALIFTLFSLHYHSYVRSNNSALNLMLHSTILQMYGLIWLYLTS